MPSTASDVLEALFHFGCGYASIEVSMGKPNYQGKRRRSTAGAQGTNTGHEDGEAMASVGVRLTAQLGDADDEIRPLCIVRLATAREARDPTASR